MARWYALTAPGSRMPVGTLEAPDRESARRKAHALFGALHVQSVPDYEEAVREADAMERGRRAVVFHNGRPKPREVLTTNGGQHGIESTTRAPARRS